MPASDLLRYVDADDIAALRGASFEPHGVVDGPAAGRYRAEQHGAAVEFAAHREYAPGDDVRHFDWRVFFRTGRKTTRQYYQDTNFTVRLLLDARRSMLYPDERPDWRLPPGRDRQDWQRASKLGYASALTVLLALTVTQRRDAFGLHVFGADQQRELVPGASPAQVARCMMTLDEITPGASSGTLERQLRSLTPRLGRRESIVLLSDGNGVTPSALGQLLRTWRLARHDVVFGHVLHRDEVEFPFDDFRAFESLDPELSPGLPTLSTDGREIRARYLERLEQFREEFRSVCQSHGATYWPVDTRHAAGTTLQRFLRARGRGRTAPRRAGEHG